MKKIIKTMAFALVAIMVLLSLCSCLKVKNTVLGWFNKSDGFTGQDLLGTDDGSKNRDSRIQGAMSKAKDTQMAYNINRSMQGLSEQPDGTKYVVESNGYYVVFNVVNGQLVSDNPDVLPSEDPYANDKNYKKVTGSMVKEIRNDCAVYLPKGAQ